MYHYLLVSLFGLKKKQKINVIVCPKNERNVSLIIARHNLD